MAIITSIIYLLVSICFFFGQLGKLNFFGVNVSFFDISLCLFFLFNIFHHHQSFKTKNRPFLVFIIIAWATFIINFFTHHFPLFIPLLYLIRLTILLSFFILPPPPPSRIFFPLIIFTNIIFGLIQYFLWPDFTAFGALGWDPHLYRLVSTFFDPTFTGLIYLLFLIYLFFNRSHFSVIVYRLSFIVTYIALTLTYSRSTFLCFVIAAIFIAIKLKKTTIGIIAVLLTTTTIILLPRFPGEGTKLERDSSIKAKIENYQEGLSLFSQSPLIGVGYDNLPYVRQIKIINSHSNSGFDGSLLTILVTTGLIGLIPFLFGFKQLYQQFSLTKKTMLLSIFIHSLFANSLLYPWTLIFLILI